MALDRRLYIGPRLRRVRRDLGLTPADMASDLDVSPSYIALLERNNRPVTADLLVRLAQTYNLDMAALAAGGGADEAARLQAVLEGPGGAGGGRAAGGGAGGGAGGPGGAGARRRRGAAGRGERRA